MLEPMRLLPATLMLLALLTGCGEPEQRAPPVSFHATDITGADFAQDFQLTDHDGKQRSLADFRGKVVAIFFGYTHCPDVCPTTLADFAIALAALEPAQAEQVQVLFATVDPERDTPELLARYVPSFHPSFLGLHGTPEQIAATAAAFKVYYQRQPYRDGYLIDHSAGSYVFDQQGRVRLYMPFGHSPPNIVDDLRQLLR